VSESFDGDLIRPLGLVTLNFAYAEFELDLLLEDLAPVETIDGSPRSWTVGKKLGKARVVLRRLRDSRLSGLEQTLTEARLLFRRRNILVHSCIVAGGRVLDSRGVRATKTSAQDLISLAESIFSCKERIGAHRQRVVRPLMAERTGNRG
jgi:hypothetical protein